MAEFTLHLLANVAMMLHRRKVL